MSFSSIHMLLNEQLYSLRDIVGNVMLVDTVSSKCSAVGVVCGAHSVSGLSCLSSLHEQPQLLTITATVWIPIMTMVVYFVLVTAGCCSGCTVCIMLHESHSASFDYRRQRRGSEADLMTMQLRRHYGGFQDI